MDSRLFDALGMDIDPGILFLIMFIMILVFFIILIFLILKYSRLKVSYEAFMSGRQAQSLESEILSLFNDIDRIKKRCYSRSIKNKKRYARLYRQKSMKAKTDFSYTNGYHR